MKSGNYNSFTEYLNSEEYQNYLKELNLAKDAFEVDSKAFFESLAYDEKLKVFSHVIRLIHQGEIVDKGSYRYLLYDIFGFETDSYALGMDCGFLDLHNSIYTYDHIESSVNTIIDYLKLDYSHKLKRDLIDIFLYGFKRKSIYPNKQLNFDF